MVKMIRQKATEIQTFQTLQTPPEWVFMASGTNVNAVGTKRFVYDGLSLAVFWTLQIKTNPQSIWTL